MEVDDLNASGNKMLFKENHLTIFFFFKYGGRPERFRGGGEAFIDLLDNPRKQLGVNVFGKRVSVEGSLHTNKQNSSEVHYYIYLYTQLLQKKKKKKNISIIASHNFFL